LVVLRRSQTCGYIVLWKKIFVKIFAQTTRDYVRGSSSTDAGVVLESNMYGP
jgi:hypothetical protein